MRIRNKISIVLIASVVAMSAVLGSIT